MPRGGHWQCLYEQSHLNSLPWGHMREEKKHALLGARSFYRGALSSFFSQSQNSVFLSLTAIKSSTEDEFMDELLQFSNPHTFAL